MIIPLQIYWPPTQRKEICWYNCCHNMDILPGHDIFINICIPRISGIYNKHLEIYICSNNLPKKKLLPKNIQPFYLITYIYRVVQKKLHNLESSNFLRRCEYIERKTLSKTNLEFLKHFSSRSHHKPFFEPPYVC